MKLLLERSNKIKDGHWGLNLNIHGSMARIISCKQSVYCNGKASIDAEVQHTFAIAPSKRSINAVKPSHTF